MKDFVKILLLVPMGIGWLAGAIISPFIVGFLAGLQGGEDLIVRLDE